VTFEEFVSVNRELCTSQTEEIRDDTLQITEDEPESRCEGERENRSQINGYLTTYNLFLVRL
jgi:hypothetical protein